MEIFGAIGACAIIAAVFLVIFGAYFYVYFKLNSYISYLISKKLGQLSALDIWMCIFLGALPVFASIFGAALTVIFIMILMKDK